MPRTLHLPRYLARLSPRKSPISTPSGLRKCRSLCVNSLPQGCPANFYSRLKTPRARPLLTHRDMRAEIRLSSSCRSSRLAWSWSPALGHSLLQVLSPPCTSVPGAQPAWRGRGLQHIDGARFEGALLLLGGEAASEMVPVCNGRTVCSKGRRKTLTEEGVSACKE